MTNSTINQSTTDIPTPVDITLRRKRSSNVASPAVVFSQEVPAPAREEFNRGAASIGKDPETGLVSLKKSHRDIPRILRRP